MSMRCSGVASRSFIIGSRLWPPAMMRAPAPTLPRAAIATSTLVARLYSNGAGVCIARPSIRWHLATHPGLVAGLVLDRSIGADHGRARHALRPRLADLRIEQARRQAAAGDVAKGRSVG